MRDLVASDVIIADVAPIACSEALDLQRVRIREMIEPDELALATRSTEPQATALFSTLNQGPITDQVRSLWRKY